MAGTYDQYCAVAAALDVVGDRWTLLIVRELLCGPRRNGQLAQDLPGIATNLLADRLRRLEAAGLVEQAREPERQDGRTRTYRLTEAGTRLRPVVEALVRFGLGLLPPDPTGMAFRPQWLALSMSLLVRPDALPDDLVVRFEITDEDLQVQLRLDRSGVRPDPDASPDIVIAGSLGALHGALRDPDRGLARIAAGELRATGSRSALGRLAAALA
jgi:DNA-binding HxlR family transcriptional regulator